MRTICDTNDKRWGRLTSRYNLLCCLLCLTERLPCALAAALFPRQRPVCAGQVVVRAPLFVPANGVDHIERTGVGFRLARLELVWSQLERDRIVEAIAILVPPDRPQWLWNHEHLVNQRHAGLVIRRDDVAVPDQSEGPERGVAPVDGRGTVWQLGRCHTQARGGFLRHISDAIEAHRARLRRAGHWVCVTRGHRRGPRFEHLHVPRGHAGNASGVSRSSQRLVSSSRASSASRSGRSALISSPALCLPGSQKAVKRHRRNRRARAMAARTPEALSAIEPTASPWTRSNQPDEKTLNPEYLAYCARTADP